MLIMQKRCMGCMKPRTEDTKCPFCDYQHDLWAQTRAQELQPGTILGDRYIVGKVLGTGGFGLSYIGFDTSLEVPVAIKEFFPRHLASRDEKSLEIIPKDEESEKEYSTARDRFLDEVRTAADFDEQAAIVTVKDYFPLHNSGYMVMTFADGITLSKYIDKRGGKLIPAEAIELFTPLLSALKTLHSKNLVHRDISPENILVTKDGEIRLLDFGSSRYTNKDDSKFTTVIKETYSPPEQYSNKVKQGPWTDIYSLSATLYLTLTGKKPPSASKRYEGEKLIPPKELNPDLSEDINQALIIGLHMSPKKRYRNIDDFRNRFCSIHNSSPKNRFNVRLFIKNKWKLITISTIIITALTFGLLYIFRPTKVITISAKQLKKMTTPKVQKATVRVRKKRKRRRRKKRAYKLVKGAPAILKVDSNRRGFSIVLDKGTDIERSCKVPCILGNIRPGRHRLTTKHPNGHAKTSQIRFKPSAIVNKRIP